METTQTDATETVAPTTEAVATARTLEPLPLRAKPDGSANTDAADVDWFAAGIEWDEREPEINADGKQTGRMVPKHVSEKGQTFYGSTSPVIVDIDKVRKYVSDEAINGAMDASGWRIPSNRVCRQKLGAWRTNKVPLYAADGRQLPNVNASVGWLDEMHTKLLRKAVWDSLMGIRGETKRAPKTIEIVVTKIVEKPIIMVGSATYDGPADVDELRSWYVNMYTDAGVPLAAVQMLVPGDETLAAMVAGMTAANG